MKNFKINAQILVAVISVSLAGIIGLQAYLFRSAIYVRDAKFNSEAAAALELVSKRLEALEAQRFLAAQVKQKNQVFGYDSKLLNDSVLMYEAAQEGILDSTIFNDGKVIHSQFELRLDTAGIQSQFDRQIVIRAAMQQEAYERFVLMKLKRMDTLFRQMLSQGMGNFVPFEARFTKQEIDSVLKAELNQKGLNLDYEFAVVEDGYISPIKTRNFSPQEADFKVPLYKNDFFSGPKWLLISFPQKINYLLRSMWTMLLLSGVFTLFIIIAFGYTVNQMQKQKKISQIKSDFINNMTHEFKTPIATINLAVDALANKKVMHDEVRTKHYQQVIKTENARMHSQVEKVLQLAMLDKQELELRQNEIDIHDLIESSVNHLILQIEDKGGIAETNLKATQFTVLGDELHLGNVFVNMIDNAIKYAKDFPQIKISTFNENGQLYIAIKDNGEGMSKEVQRKIFDRFYRQSGGNIHDVKGHGLGLSYVREIIEMHNGTISVVSAPGKGSTFTITLPLKIT